MERWADQQQQICWHAVQYQRNGCYVTAHPLILRTPHSCTPCISADVSDTSSNLSPLSPIYISTHLTIEVKQRTFAQHEVLNVQHDLSAPSLGQKVEHGTEQNLGSAPNNISKGVIPSVPGLRLYPYSTSSRDWSQSFLQGSNNPVNYSNAQWIISWCALPRDIKSISAVLHKLTIKRIVVAQYVLRWTKGHDNFFLDELHHTRWVEQFRKHRPGNRPVSTFVRLRRSSIDFRHWYEVAAPQSSAIGVK